MEGSQWRPHPPLVMNQAVPGTTPSKRRVTQHGLVHNKWGVGRHCGPDHRHCACPMQEKMQEHKSKHKQGETAPAENPKRTPNNDQKHPNPEKKTATRPKKTHRKETFCRASGPKTHGKSQKKTPGGRALMSSSMKREGLCR